MGIRYMLFFSKKVKDPDEVEGCVLRRRIRRNLSARIKEIEKNTLYGKPGGGKAGDDVIGLADDDMIGIAKDIESLRISRTRLQRVRWDVGKKGIGYLYAMSDYQKVSDQQQRGTSGGIEDYFMINMHRYYDLVEKEGKKTP